MDIVNQEQILVATEETRHAVPEALLTLEKPLKNHVKIFQKSCT